MVEYRWAIVSFFDILGFRKMIETLTCDEIYKILKTFHHYSIPQDKLSKDVQEEREISIINFSDSIIRIFPIDNKSNLQYPEGMVFHELLDLIHIQGELSAKKILLRGAVTIGQVFSDGNICYGPGFIDAYKMESEKARYPRIIVDPNLIKAVLEVPIMKALHHDAKYEVKQIKHLLRKDDDGYLFIDYLRVMDDEVDTDEDFLFFLKIHRQIITEGLKSKDAKVRRKHKWLKKYYNHSIRQLNIEFCRYFNIKKKELCVSEISAKQR